MDIETVLSKNKKELLKKDNVIGVALGQDDKGQFISIMVSDKIKEKGAEIPKSISGYRVKIVETGTFRVK
ncbi:hypothetical protein JW930_00475 [Candidatus Woesearchaeota archaeon]|nr:hypothetical protein [Candidatus Woesearchaeota archaeon]